MAHQAPLFMEFPRQEYWSGLPFPPGDLCNPGIKPASLVSPALTGGFFTTEPPRKTQGSRLVVFNRLHEAAVGGGNQDSWLIGTVVLFGLMEIFWN